MVIAITHSTSGFHILIVYLLCLFVFTIDIPKILPLTPCTNAVQPLHSHGTTILFSSF